MSKEKNTSPAGMGFSGALAILFIALKLTNFITWPWIWVLSPIWMPIALVVFFAILYLALK